MRFALRPRLFPSRGPATAPAADPAWRLAVGGWAVLAGVLLAFVLRLGSDAPLSDEWALLPPLVGEAAVWPWAWEPHNEHRYPLPRLLWYAAHRLSGHDFRAGMVLSVGLVAGAALALVAAARRVRGRSHPADLLVPALLLHLGHHENWLIGYQIAFTLVAALVGLVASLAVGVTGPPRTRTVLAAGGAVAALPLCGGAGVLFAGPLAGWVLATAVVRVRAGSGRAAAGGMVGLPVVALGSVAAYLAAAGGSTPGAGVELGVKARTAVELLTGGAGAAARAAWPASGAVAAGLFAAAGVGLALVAVRRAGADRLAAGGLLAALVGLAGVAAAVGAGRGGMLDGIGFSSRYGLFSAVGLAAVYLAGVRFVRGPSGRWGAAGGVLLAAVVVAAAAPGGVGYGEVMRHASRNMRYQAAAGAPASEIATGGRLVVFVPADTPEARRVVADGLQLLERHRIGPYRPR